MMKRLTTVRDSIEATFLQHALENEGIESFATNEHTSTLLPHWYGMLGHGIQIMVHESDYERATQILEKRKQESEPVHCPNCGSTDIGYGVKGRGRLREQLVILISLIFFVPMGNIRNKNYCRNCGTVFG